MDVQVLTADFCRLVNTVLVSPLCAQHALKSLRTLIIPCPLLQKRSVMAGGMETHR